MSFLAHGARLLNAFGPGRKSAVTYGSAPRNTLEGSLCAVPADELVRDELRTPLGRRVAVYRLLGTAGLVADSTVAIGQFDGVHRGHQALLAEAVDRAAEIGSAVGAVTFDRHPMSLLAPDRKPRVLTELDEKIGLLLAAGLDFVAVLHLEPELLATDPAPFVDDVLVSTLAVRAVLVGPNFRFGRRAAGDPGMLASLGVSRGFSVHCPELLYVGDTAVSSTRIRAAIASGDLAGAASMLGRPLAIAGRVLGRAGASLNVVLPDGAARGWVGRLAGCLRLHGDAAVFPVRVTIAGARAVLRLPRGTALSPPADDVFVVDLVSGGFPRPGARRVEQNVVTAAVAGDESRR